MDYQILNKELINNFGAKEKEILNEFFEVEQLNLMKLRDILLGLGKIYKEDLEQNIYIAIIDGGLCKKNKAVAGFCLTKEGLSVAVYAKHVKE